VAEPIYIATADCPAFLASRGFKVSKAYFKKITSPSVGKGPQSAGFWGNRKVFTPEELLRWAHGRIRPTRQEAA
jgi:hypothetical protein